MTTSDTQITVISPSDSKALAMVAIPAQISAFGDAGHWCWEEFFAAKIRNRHTRAAYMNAVRRFLAWVDVKGVQLTRVTPGMVGHYFDQHSGSVPTRKLHLAALRSFFDLLVTRHLLVLNPVASVRGERYSVTEGKTLEISKAQARQLLASIDLSRPVGLRDRAIFAALIYTAARAGAVASLRISDLQWDGTQYQFRFAEKGGKSRLIPVRHDLQGYLMEYLATFDWKAAPKDSPLFRSIAGRTGQLTERSIRNVDINRLMKRRLRDASLPTNLSPHSCRVSTITNLLEEGVALEDVQFLVGHSDPRTTRLYDRRQRKVTRNTVERISI